jgi:predicted anti-sigma-YlaC factor YlaD
MRTMRTTGRRCDRAREYASLRLDGELSDFERALLDSHLDRCSSCRAFADDLVAVTGRLRAAPLEQPSIVVTLPRRRFVAMRNVQVSAAAAAVVSVVGIGALFGMLHSSATAPTSGIATKLGSSMAGERREFTDLRRAVLTTPHPERHPGGLGVLEV